MTQTPYDVIVVGAGPAGSYCALKLAERGHGVLLLDKSPEPRRDIVCTGIVGSEAFDDLDLPDTPGKAELARARFVSPSGVEVTYEPKTPFARVVDRGTFDEELVERAVGAGVRLERGIAARGVERDDAGVMVRCRNGDDRTFRARALVVATGHQRWLHAPAGLGAPTSYVHGVHADLPFADIDVAELYFGNQVAPGFFAWAVPFGPGMARLGVLARQGATRHFQRFLRSSPIRDRLGVDLDGEGGDLMRERLRSRGIVQGMVTPSVADRVVAVGEAAGQVKTTTAGGIYYGMLGADLAAGVLSEGLSCDRLDARWLSRYERAWRRRLEPEIELGLDLQHAGAALDDDEIDELFRTLAAGLDRVVRQVVRFDWHGPAMRVLFRHSRTLMRMRRAGRLRAAS